LLVHFIIDAVRLDDLQGNLVTENRATNNPQEDLTITRNASNNVILEVQKAHLAVNSRATQAAKLLPSGLNDAIPATVNRPIWVAGLDLELHPGFAHYICAQKVQIPLEVFVVALKVARPVAKIGERPPDFTVRASVTWPKIRKKPPFTSGGIQTLLRSLRRAAEQVKNAH
jgi:hypothetical protein